MENDQQFLSISPEDKSTSDMGVDNDYFKMASETFEYLIGTP